MILEDRIFIRAPAAKLFAFFDEMERNYTRWHKDHVLFAWRGPKGVALGNRFFFAETIAGELQMEELAFTEVERDRRMAFAPTNRFFRLFLPRISFDFREADGGTEVTARVVVRIGPLARWLHRDGINAVKRHMREECRNLKLMMDEPAAMPRAA